MGMFLPSIRSAYIALTQSGSHSLRGDFASMLSARSQSSHLRAAASRSSLYHFLVISHIVPHTVPPAQRFSFLCFSVSSDFVWQPVAAAPVVFLAYCIIFLLCSFLLSPLPKKILNFIHFIIKWDKIKYLSSYLYCVSGLTKILA